MTSDGRGAQANLISHESELQTRIDFICHEKNCHGNTSVLGFNQQHSSLHCWLLKFILKTYQTILDQQIFFLYFQA